MSESSFVLVSPSANADIKPSSIDWGRCFLCGLKESKKVKLTNPSNGKGFSRDRPETHGAYISAAENIESLQISDYLSEHLEKRVLIITSTEKENVSTKSALHDAFVKNSACFHKKCLTDLKRKNDQKRKRSLPDEFVSKDEEYVTPKKRTRSSFTADNYSKNCFFCDKSHGTLHECRTENLTKHVEEKAKYLMRDDLVAKLSVGDLVAIEAKYHKDCLSSLHNKCRAKIN